MELIMLNFKEFIEQNTVGKHNDFAVGATVSSDSLGGDSIPNNNSTFLRDVILPSVTRTSTIRFIDKNKNPILVYLTDGTKLFFSWDEFKRIKGLEPKIGKKLTVVFQRNEKDNSESPSKINSVTCI